MKEILITVISSSGVVLAAVIPSLISNSRRTKKMENTIGKKNGNGSLVEMQEKMLEYGLKMLESNQSQDKRLANLESWQTRHSREITDLTHRVESMEKKIE